MAKARKLIGRNCLQELHELSSRGVPKRRLKRDFRLLMHHTTLNNILEAYALALEGDTVAEASLFPPWLHDNDHITEAPLEWNYFGDWPRGFWAISHAYNA